MPGIASTGAMLLCGHRKHHLEVGLSLPSLILDQTRKRRAPTQVLASVTTPKAPVNCFYRTCVKRHHLNPVAARDIKNGGAARLVPHV
jgi:hypothetical protein